MTPDETRLEDALRPFGWTCSDDFWRRYYTDPWVFNLANAVERLTIRLATAEAELERVRRERDEALVQWADWEDEAVAVHAEPPEMRQALRAARALEPHTRFCGRDPNHEGRCQL